MTAVSDVRKWMDRGQKTHASMHRTRCARNFFVFLAIVAAAMWGFPAQAKVSSPEADSVGGPGLVARQNKNPVSPCIDPADGQGCSDHWLTPADLASLYNIPAEAQADTTSTIAILVVGAYNANTEGDMDAYRQEFGLPACSGSSGCFQALNADGGTDLTAETKEDPDGEMEPEMDAEAVSAICPHCRILMLQCQAAATSTGHGTCGQAISTGYGLGARYFSVSYGSDQPVWPLSFLDGYPDIVVTASSGDDRYPTFGNVTDGAGFKEDVGYPAADPHVVAVGGTTATVVAGQWVQYPWSHSGTGCADSVPRPLYQQDVSAIATACPNGGRATADISAIASDFLMKFSAPLDTTNCASVSSNCWINGGGTSLASPIIAAMFALAGNHTNPHGMYDYSRIYPSTLYDITAFAAYEGSAGGQCVSGGLCNAQTGWDGMTGVGAPDGLDALRSTIISPTPSETDRTPYPIVPGPVFVSGGWRISSAGTTCEAMRGSTFQEEAGSLGISATTLSGQVGAPITWSPVPAPVDGVSYRMTMTDSSGNSTSLPPGLSWDPMSMTLSGTPSRAGTFTLSFEASCIGEESLPLTVTIAPAAAAASGSGDGSTSGGTNAGPAPASPVVPALHHRGGFKINGKARARERLTASIGTYTVTTGTTAATTKTSAGITVTITWRVGAKTVHAGPSLKIKKAWRGKKVSFIVHATYPGAGMALTGRSKKVNVKS